jgi:hypothetical protein
MNIPLRNGHRRMPRQTHGHEGFCARFAQPRLYSNTAIPRATAAGHCRPAESTAMRMAGPSSDRTQGRSSASEEAQRGFGLCVSLRYFNETDDERDGRGFHISAVAS